MSLLKFVFALIVWVVVFSHFWDAPSWAAGGFAVIMADRFAS